MITAKFNDTQYQNFSHIFRTDTHFYTVDDILDEYEEWRYILTDILGYQEAYEVGEVYISDRLTSCLAKTGRRKTVQSKYGHITVNGNYIKYHSNPDNFHSTLAHETIHTLAGCFNHGNNFLIAGRKLSTLYSGINIQRTLNDPGYISWLNNKKPYIPREQRNFKYKIVCPKCGQIIYRERLSKLVKSPEKFRCGRCHSQFDVYEVMPDGTEVRRMFIKI